MEHKHTAETQQISLRLEHYDDIFSDFDMRPYSKRALSVDFLEEIKRASHDKHISGIELVLHVPETVKDEYDEMIIKDRLSAHFKKHFDLRRLEKNKIKKFGYTMVGLGAIAMAAATLIVFKDPHESLLMSFLLVFLEPAAWFLLWEGMDQVIFSSKSINPELEFYRKMAHERGGVHFRGY